MTNAETPTQGANMDSDLEHAQRIIKSQSESIENLIKAVNLYIEISNLRLQTVDRLQNDNDKLISENGKLIDLCDKYNRKVKRFEADNSTLVRQITNQKDSIVILNAFIDKLEELEREDKTVIKDLANQIIDYKKTIADLDNRLGLKYPPIV